VLAATAGHTELRSMFCHVRFFQHTAWQAQTSCACLERESQTQHMCYAVLHMTCWRLKAPAELLAGPHMKRASKQHALWSSVVYSAHSTRCAVKETSSQQTTCILLTSMHGMLIAGHASQYIPWCADSRRYAGMSLVTMLDTQLQLPIIACVVAESY
jgi:hypothetical protein